MSTEDIDAVLAEWQGSRDAMRWAPDMDEEAVDGDYYRATADPDPYGVGLAAGAARMDRGLARAVTFGARFGGGGVLVGDGSLILYETPPMVDGASDGSRDLGRVYLGFTGGRSVTMDFPRHDEYSCPVCQMTAQMAGLLGEEQSRMSEDSVREMMRIFSGERPAFRWDDESPSRLRPYEIAVDEALRDIRYGRADGIEDPVEKVAFLAVYGTEGPPGPVTVRNWRPRQPLRPLDASEPIWTTFTGMMRG